ncbi:MAG: hypothetical protein HYW56_01315 [Candidatus Harrisonbacteria bacterium]|nr:hypothetical protein [Candidatus Harrisonbacteria bacterium]MBI2604162.1 hypothetical protein [Candidatus Harrisonbacteria bacterium]
MAKRLNALSRLAVLDLRLVIATHSALIVALKKEQRAKKPKLKKDGDHRQTVHALTSN